MRSGSSLPLFWRVCAINGTVFAMGTLALAFSPATVSERPLISEMVILAFGLVAIAALNGLLLFSDLRPLDQLAETFTELDLSQPNQRLAPGRGPANKLVDGFNTMAGRLDRERQDNATRALQAQEAERQRLAQELHDEVGQSLTAVLLGLKSASAAAPADVAQRLEALREATRTSLDEVRRISQRLRPGVLHELGLLNSLSSLASDVSTRTTIPVRRKFVPGLPPLPADAELVVYRIAQEALTNVARHSRATSVDFEIAQHADQLRMTITDNGVGGADKVADTAGIQGMQERAAIVGGAIRIDSPVGAGTTVSLRIPLRELP